MKYLLDTNICIYLIKQRPSAVLDRFRALSAGEVGVSSITVAELQYGIEKSTFQEKNRAALTKFFLPLETVVFDSAAANAYGQIRAKLERAGTPIGAMDLLIAAQAVSLGVFLVTNNVREFERIEGLKIENWV